MRAASLLLGIALVAGCLAPSTEQEARSAPTAPTPAATAADDANATEERNATVAPRAPAKGDAYLTADHALSLAVPAEGTRAMTSATDPDPWALPPLPVGIVITAAVVDVWVSSDAPQGSSSGLFALWLGEPDRSESFTRAYGPLVIPPGEPTRVTAELALPAGGLVVPASGTLALYMHAMYSQSPAAPILVHVGGDSPSRVEITHAVREETSARAPATTGFAGEIAWGETVEFPIEIGASVARVEAKLEGRENAAGIDLDVELRSPSGELVASSTSPGATEVLRAFRENFAEAGPGAFTLRVTVSSGHVGSFAGGSFSLAVAVVDSEA